MPRRSRHRSPTGLGFLLLANPDVGAPLDGVGPVGALPVAASAVAIGTIVVALAKPHDGAYLRFVALILALQIVVEAVGFAFHVTANLAGPGGLRENFLHGAPVFSPLLFPDLALLAAIAVLVLAESRMGPTVPPAS